MGSSYIPSKRTDYVLWAANFDATAGLIGAQAGLLPADLSAITSANQEAQLAFTASEAARLAWETAVATEKLRFGEATAVFRQKAQKIQDNPGTTDPMRTQFRITVRKPRSPRERPTVPPFMRIYLSEPFIHEVDVRGSLERRAKPVDASGYELFVAYTQPGGQPPASLAGFSFLTSGGRAPVRIELAPVDVMKVAWYAARWTNERGQAGPLCLPIGAVVLGNPIVSTPQIRQTGGEGESKFAIAA